MELKELLKEDIFYYFKEISDIPRGSGNEKAISDYLVSFAKERDLKFVQDEVNNVIIYKNGTSSSTTPVGIQGHIDMVCEKNDDKSHDFLNDPISLVVDGDYLRGDNTTLGADNGVAVAIMLAILNRNDLKHPPLEMIFTVEEEVGMLGAKTLDGSLINARKLINIDNCEEGEFITSCAGGLRCKFEIPVVFENYDFKNSYSISVKGLIGGHSGMDINKNLGNSNIILTRILKEISNNTQIGIVSISGGSKDNAIPREAFATINTSKEIDLNELRTFIDLIKKEYSMTDKNLTVDIEENLEIKPSIGVDNSNKLINLLLVIPNGVLSMSPAISNLVETSNNVGVIITNENFIEIRNGIRSSIESKKGLVKEQFNAISQSFNVTATFTGDYFGWEYNPISPIRDIFMEKYNELFSTSPDCLAIHAGLECGLFSKKIPDMDMIAIGPNILGAHTPKEKLEINSFRRTYELVLNTLESL